MMGVLGTEQQLCPCYKNCQQFHKLVELKDTGLVVYCHSTRRANVRQGADTESDVKDVFILHNTRGVKITTAGLTSELEKNDISCLRCRKTFEHAQELLQKVPSIGRRNTIGVCDHCRKRAQYIKKPCFTCKEIVEKFISVRDKQKEDTKRDVKSWLSRMGHLLKDTMNLDRPKKLETRTFSDAQINQLLLKPPKGRREPEVQQMFCPESHKSYTNILVDKTTDVKEYNVPEKSVAFTQPIEPPKTTLDLRSLSVETGTTFVGTHVPEQKPPPKRTSLKERKQEDKSDHYDKYSMDAKEAIKKKHDLSLRQMVGKNFGATSKRPEIYEILKIAPWQHPKTELKDHDGISEIFIKLPKIKEDFSSESTSDSEDSESYKLIRYRSRTSQKEPKLKRSEYVVDPKLYVKEPYKAKHLPSRTSEKSSRDTRSEQYRRDKYDHGELKKDIFDSELIFQKIKRDEYQLHDKEFKSEQGLAKLTREKAIGSKDSAENLLKTQFSFFFPKKVKKLKKQFKVHSSELIRDTQEKIRLEKEQKHEKETKMLAVKEKKLQDEERQRQSVRDEKEYTVDMRITGERSKSLEEWERKPLTEVEKQGKIKRSLSKEDKYKTDRDRRDMTLESEFKSKLSIDSGSVTKDSKQRTHPRDRMETGKMLKQKPEDEIEAVIEETKHKGKTDRELEKSKRDLKSKSERIDTFDDVTDKARKELSSKTDRQLEKSNKDLKSKSERIDTFDDVTDKARKELSSKTDRQLEKSKKDLKSKSDRSDTYVDTIDKAKKEDSSKTDKQLEKSKRDLKSKSAKSYTYDDTKDKAKKEGSPKTDRDVKSKSGRTDKFDDVTEKARKELSSKTDRQLEKSKRDLKSKSAKSDTYDDTKDKAKKEGSPKTDRDVKSKSGRTDKFDDVTEKARKELSSKTDRQLEKSKRDLKSKSAKSDTYDDTKDKAKKEGGSKTVRKDKYDEVSEIAEKVLKTKSGLKDRPEEVSRKEKETKKESKLKPEQKEISTPVLKKDHQMRSEPKEKDFEVSEKGKKVTDTDDEMLLAIKSKKKEKPKAKRDSGDKDIEIKLKRKPGQEVIKGDAAPEQLKKDLKARAEGGKSVESKRDRKEEEHKDKSEKEKKSKSETKGWDKQMEKDMAIALKNKEKEEHAEKLQRDKEEKERLKLVQQLRKEKEDQKKQLKKEGELQQKSMKDKETLKKSDKSPKVQKTTDLMPGKDTMEKESKDKGPKKEETSKVAPEPKEESKKKVKESAEEAEFRKLQAQLKKDKEEALKRKKMEEAEAQKLRDLAEKRAQEEAERKQKSLQSKAEPKSPESQLSEGFTPGRAKLDPRDFDPKLLKAHKHHFKCGHDSNLCILCFDSDLEIDHESYANKINRKNTEITDIIIGEYIFNYKLIREKTEETNVPLLFQSKFIEEFIEQPPGDLRIVSPKVDESENKAKPILAALLASKDTKGKLKAVHDHHKTKPVSSTISN